MQLHDSQKEVLQLQQRLDDIVESFHTKESSYLEQIRLLQSRIEDLQNPKQIEVFMSSADLVEPDGACSGSTPVQENSDFQINVQAERHNWFSFLRKSKKVKLKNWLSKDSKRAINLSKIIFMIPIIQSSKRSFCWLQLHRGVDSGRS